MRMSKKKRSEQWYERQEEVNKELERETAERVRHDKEFVASLSPEKRRQYKVVKVVFIVFMVIFYIAALISYCKGWRALVSTMLIEIGVALISAVFWRDPPKKFPCPQAFAMPILAFALTVVGIGGFFLRDALNGKFSQHHDVPVDIETPVDGYQTEENKSDYELWLRGNNVIEDDKEGGQ